MPDISNLDDVKAVLRAVEEEQEDIFYDLPYANPGIFLEDVEGLPEGWIIYIREANTERNYDSYGNAYTEDAFVVFGVTDDSNEVLYLLPVSYASFEGWNINISNLVKTEKKEKVITFWETARD